MDVPYSKDTVTKMIYKRRYGIKARDDPTVKDCATWKYTKQVNWPSIDELIKTSGDITIHAD